MEVCRVETRPTVPA
ncbi:hypothetical protein E2C01_101572 [Portunus trituberculatus]|uniref:Uncharacterized protein n=1 Tax=Portunus trituberculatus TaxID=210409 RepID=A0A5B7KG25_PORTR|nr:hypothetical protein [Portunus trituberculatus]